MPSSSIEIVRQLYAEFYNQPDSVIAMQTCQRLFEFPGQSHFDEHLRLRTAFPNWQVVIERLITEGDTIVVRWTAQGDQTGTLAHPLVTVPPTGRHVVITGTSIYEIRAGRVASRIPERAEVEFLRQLGVQFLPPAP
ncbi:MAG: ester cyclase [Ktedonobacterales bacterium]